MSEQRTRVRVLSVCAVLAVAGTLAACGKHSLDGAYVARSDVSHNYDRLTFSPDGKVVAVFNGNPVKPVPYKIVKNEVWMEMHPNSYFKFKIDSDDCLVGLGEFSDGTYCMPKK